MGTEHRFATVNWMEIPAFQRLGFGEQTEEIIVDDVAEVVGEVKSLFE